jgi:23S rRNA pseudouridine2604 synthase
VLTEGRNRQIRRMCELVELTVVDLLRVRIGALRLGDLPEGRWRPLTAAERASLVGAPG